MKAPAPKNTKSPWDLRQMAYVAPTQSRANELFNEAERLEDQLFNDEARRDLITQRSHEACRRDNPKPVKPRNGGKQ